MTGIREELRYAHSGRRPHRRSQSSSESARFGRKALRICKWHRNATAQNPLSHPLSLHLMSSVLLPVNHEERHANMAGRDVHFIQCLSGWTPRTPETDANKVMLSTSPVPPLTIHKPVLDTECARVTATPLTLFLPAARPGTAVRSEIFKITGPLNSVLTGKGG
ncbi:hypothetical protein BJ322DRAFT_1015812 [Thelephora terrestris]|uniref:Uncharacterized protein n=1 Tax=Thelephora terrestris TaxID=56493 RepID=A0A9P6HQ88_9AGAM|nr:hypothetical protein BJ322DRAFT_1015812 [Thelephora terrestris]